MIQYGPRERARRDEEMAKLRAATSPQSRAAAISKLIYTETHSIAEVMREIHGGEWSVEIDHDDCFVLISRDLPVCP